MPIKHIYFVRHKDIFDAPNGDKASAERLLTDTACNILSKSRKKDGNLDIYLYLFADGDYNFRSYFHGHAYAGALLNSDIGYNDGVNNALIYFSRALMALSKSDLGHIIDIFDNIAQWHDNASPDEPHSLHPLHLKLMQHYRMEWRPNPDVEALCAKKHRDYLTELRDALQDDEVVSILMEGV
jgi:hypothetical protein